MWRGCCAERHKQLICEYMCVGLWPNPQRYCYCSHLPSAVVGVPVAASASHSLPVRPGNQHPGHCGKCQSLQASQAQFASACTSCPARGCLPPCRERCTDQACMCASLQVSAVARAAQMGALIKGGRHLETLAQVGSWGTLPGRPRTVKWGPCLLVALGGCGYYSARLQHAATSVWAVQVALPPPPRAACPLRCV